MKMKRVRSLFIATALTCSLVAVPVFATPSLEDQKAAVESEVNSLQSQLTTLMSKMTELQNQLITKGEEIIAAEEQLVEAQEKEKQQYEDMKLRIKYMYEEGDGSAIERILTSGSIAEMLSQAEYVQKIHTYDRNMLTTYVDTVNEVKELKESLVEDRNKLESMQSEYQTQSEELSSTLENKSEEIANLDDQIQEAARIAAEEEAARQEAARLEAERQSAASSNNANSNNNTGNSGSSNNSGNDNTTTTPPQTSTGNNTSTGNTSAAQAIVNAAWTQIGVPYVWGGTSAYSGLDCSGLTQWCHAQAGIYIGRVDTAQLAGGRQVSDPQPGDIAWTPGHVAIYIGNGQMIEAQQPGTTVCVSPVRASVYVRYW